MVRINLIHPKKLADQHLIAEYNEILMLLGHVKKFPHLKESILKDDPVHTPDDELIRLRAILDFFNTSIYIY